MKIATSPCEIAEFQRLKHVGISSRPNQKMLIRSCLARSAVCCIAACQRGPGQLRVKSTPERVTSDTSGSHPKADSRAEHRLGLKCASFCREQTQQCARTHAGFICRSRFALTRFVKRGWVVRLHEVVGIQNLHQLLIIALNAAHTRNRAASAAAETAPNSK
jgi:hypothetical protein